MLLAFSLKIVRGKKIKEVLWNALDNFSARNEPGHLFYRGSRKYIDLLLFDMLLAEILQKNGPTEND